MLNLVNHTNCVTFYSETMLLALVAHRASTTPQTSRLQQRLSTSADATIFDDDTGWGIGKYMPGLAGKRGAQMCRRPPADRRPESGFVMVHAGGRWFAVFRKKVEEQK